MAESTKIRVKLTGANGNVFNLIAICRKAMRKAGTDSGGYRRVYRPRPIESKL